MPPKPSKKTLYISAKDCVRDYPKELYEDGGKLFFQIFSCVLDHSRNSTIDDHVKKKKKKKHLSRVRDEEETGGAPAAKR